MLRIQRRSKIDASTRLFSFVSPGIRAVRACRIAPFSTIAVPRRVLFVIFEVLDLAVQTHDNFRA